MNPLRLMTDSLRYIGLRNSLNSWHGILKDMKEYLFFSIIVPAHNEEEYIARTLEHLVAQEYPKDRFEVLVIENGSYDSTYEMAKRFEGTNVHLYSYPQKGVSAARNRGSEHAKADGDWALFLDADTLLAPGFLARLNGYMHKYKLEEHAAGSMSIQPIVGNIFVRSFFTFGNFCRRFTKFPYAAFLIRRDLLERIQFDEVQEVGEDVAFFASACQYGRAFFFHTHEVATSVRRFRNGRWVRRTLSWFSLMPLAGRAFHKTGYKVIR